MRIVEAGDVVGTRVGCSIGTGVIGIGVGVSSEEIFERPVLRVMLSSWLESVDPSVQVS